MMDYEQNGIFSRHEQKVCEEPAKGAALPLAVHDQSIDQQQRQARVRQETLNGGGFVHICYCRSLASSAAANKLLSVSIPEMELLTDRAIDARDAGGWLTTIFLWS